MAPLLYELSVPMFIRQLGNLRKFLSDGEKWCEENNVPKEKLTEGRIIEDMLVRRLVDHPLPRPR